MIQALGLCKPTELKMKSIESKWKKREHRKEGKKYEEEEEVCAQRNCWHMEKSHETSMKYFITVIAFRPLTSLLLRRRRLFPICNRSRHWLNPPIYLMAHKYITAMSCLRHTLFQSHFRQPYFGRSILCCAMPCHIYTVWHSRELFANEMHQEIFGRLKCHTINDKPLMYHTHFSGWYTNQK